MTIKTTLEKIVSGALIAAPPIAGAVAGFKHAYSYGALPAYTAGLKFSVTGGLAVMSTLIGIIHLSPSIGPTSVKPITMYSVYSMYSGFAGLMAGMAVGTLARGGS